jgi:D-aspartate ligase
MSWIVSTPLHEAAPLKQPAPQERVTPRAQTAPEAAWLESQATGSLPVIILSGGVTGLGVLRTFARQGIPSYVYAAGTEDPIRHSRWYRAVPGSDDRASLPTPSVSALEKALVDSQLPGAFICACSDEWNRIVAAYSESQSNFVSMAPSRIALEIVQNKGNLAMLLQSVGVPMPTTLPVESAADITNLPQSNDTFYFLKPHDSQSFLQHFGVKGIRLRSEADARRWLDVIHSANMRVVLQEYIPGPASEHFFIDGYADSAGNIKALFARQRQRIHPPDFGNSTAMISVPLADVAGAVESVRCVLAAADYQGIFSVEFKRDPRDGEFKLLEINTRPWWFVDFAVRCGVDVCRMAYDDAQGQEVRPIQSYSIGKTCIFPYYDFFSTRAQVAAGQMSWRRWALAVIQAMQPVACLDDPKPAIAATARIVRKALRNRLSSDAA